MTLVHAGPRPAGRLAVAGGLALAVALALFAFGRAHTPNFTMGCSASTASPSTTSKPSSGLRCWGWRWSS
jgi:hypothetical protein